ncbi:solute carrier family 2, facilitated glucose transporter member 1-like isoform X2 [Mucor ambiguus]|uniref:Solute carrier family 2, facilitated glucose transporter member 1-like isoform X2 n=1 Tax=Mucor ambiguus TaxID=91626 RepID=A0A0C9MII0_9FUNG|nr:solute carrier family 2, facilitated glucose transporter member 1-like isoform X2 [Mucor ambiguus]
MSDSVWGTTIGAYALGGLVGSLASRYLNDRFERKTNMMIAGFWMILGGMLSALSVNTPMYALGRACVGVSAGASGSSVGIYVSEIATTETRGALGCLYELFLNLGILLTQVAGLYMSYVPVWRYLWAIPSLLTAIQMMCLYLLCVESPRYLMSVGKSDRAKAALYKLRGKACEVEWTELESSILTHADNRAILSIKELLFNDKRIRNMALVVCVIQMYNQIGGVGPMSIYSVGFLTRVFQGNTITATTVTLASSAGSVIATFISVIYMHRVGRKGFMLISTMGMAISAVLLVIGSASPNAVDLAPLSITASVLFVFTYSMGCGVVPWMIAPELLPLTALPSGSALANACNWLVNFIVNTVWPPMNAGLGNYSFVVFAVINFLGAVFVWFCMPETTGKDLDTLIDVEQPGIKEDVDLPYTAK